jgi:chromosome segregation ATPase
MSQDKEKIKELARRIKDLEGTIEQRNLNLQDYQDIERIADEKIKGLNAIHAEKIRSLMNSIQMLKKENASMGKQTKEHKRSELIQQLNKDITDQDTVIGVLRGMIGDQGRADGEIIKTLTKGPPRIRVPTREEFKIEIKNLKASLLKYEKKKGNNTAGVENEQPAEDQSMISTNVKATEVRTGVGNAEYIMKINELNNVVEDLNLVVTGKQTEVDKYKQLLTKKNEEIIELTQSKIDLKFMITKNDELKNELEALREKMNTDLYANYDQTIKMQEIELAATIHKNIQNKTNDAIKLEIENLQNKLVEVLGQNKQLSATTTKLKDDNSAARKLLEDAKERNRKIHSEHEEQINKVNNTLKEKDASIKSLNQKLQDYESRFDKLSIEVKNRDSMITDLEIKITELEHQIETLESAPEKVSEKGSEKGGSRNNLESSMVEAKKQELEREINYLKQETFRLKERVKELTKSEIELADQVDMLEQENRFLNKKVIACNLINKEVYADSVKYEDMQAYVKEAAKRYETRIKDLVRRISELEARNKDLEEIQYIMNNASGASLKSLNGRSNSIALTETEY